MQKGPRADLQSRPDVRSALGTALALCENDALYLRVHFSADPAKRDPVYADALKRKLGKRDFAQQMDMSEEIYDGEPVYPDYTDALHCPATESLNLRASAVPILGRCQYVGGWDCGQTLHPAFVLLQVTALGQIHAMCEVIPPAPESMEAFAPRVLQVLATVLPGHWDTVEHVADATVIQRSGVDGRSAQAEALRHGFRLKPLGNQWQPRYSAVSWLLRDRIDERTPRFLLSGLLCPILREGFLGAYKYEDSPSGDSMGPGRIVKQPLKNSYSHVHDALQYAAMRARKLTESGPFERKGLRGS